MNAVSIRGEWVGTIIDGRFPLLEWLGGSSNSSVFLTELPGSTSTPENTDGSSSQKAAIKLIPASSDVEDRLTIWASVAPLPHPHLVRILYFGRTEIDGARLLYVVTELAEEVLSQILPERPLTLDETRQMLGPVLDVLAYLHSHGFVHGHLKPSNILVVNEEIKLSADGLVRAGSSAGELVENDIHCAPEIATGPAAAPSADLWSLGVTLVEALTQQGPHWDTASNTEPQVPANVQKPFDQIARECLRVDPARRAAISDVRALLEGRQKTPASVPNLPHHPHRLVERTVSPKIPLVPLIVGFLLLLAIIIGLRMRGCRTNTTAMQTEKSLEAASAEPQAQSPLPASASPHQISTGPISQGAVVHREVPDVPRSASDTIRGTITVTVRVTVNTAGAVSASDPESPGPSAYFARLATESARKWTFRPPQQNGRPSASTWLLRYEFRRDGTEVMVQETNR